MISKELFSEVLGEMVIEYDESSTGGNILYYLLDGDDWWYSINIYELAHKCKEWAMDRGYSISSSMFRDGWCSDISILDEEFEAWMVKADFDVNTEPEAIFKACEWIMEQKAKA